MHRLQELLRLHRAGLSARRAARQLGMGRNTARRYLQALEAADLLDGEDLPELADLKQVVNSQLPSLAPPQQQSSVEPWREAIAAMLERGAGPKAIYDRLRLEDADFVGSYDAVKRLCKRIGEARGPSPTEVALPVITPAGQVAQVDYFYVGKLLDPAAGRERKCWAFVMLLAFSRHMYVELVFDQRAETWARLHTAAFTFFGGVPHVIRPDNLKTAVIRAAFNSSGEVALNRSYVEMARHYDFQIDPTPAYAPKKKGKVERAGKYFRDSYIKPREFADIHEARAGIRPWLFEIAGTRIHGTTGRKPLELFEIEKGALKPRPLLPYDPIIWHKAKVHADSHVQFRRHLYSVPWRLLRQQVWVKATAATVQILADDERVATHRRSMERGRTTVDAHLPEERVSWRHSDRSYWEDRAERLGSEVLTYVSELFEADDVLLQLRKVQAVVSFLEDFPPDRREAACRRARFYGVTKVRAFKDILRKDLDLEPLPDELLATHGVLAEPRFARGAAAFHPTPIPEA